MALLESLTHFGFEALVVTRFALVIFKISTTQGVLYYTWLKLVFNATGSTSAL